MTRALWSGNISFGLVQIPVGLHSAEQMSEELPLTLLDVRDRAPVGYRHVNKATGVEVPKEMRVRGYEVAKNQYVVLTEADFRAANVKATETIEIHSFVDVDEVPLLRLERPYWLNPQKKGQKPYVLLRQALQRSAKVALATIVLRARQHLGLVLPVGEALALQLLRYDNELVDAHELGIPQGLEGVVVKPAEIEMAAKLVEGMAAPFDTHLFKDTYQDDLRAVIAARRAHPEAAPEVPKKVAKPAADVVDLMSLLQRSVQEHAGDKDSPSPAPKKAIRPRRTRTLASPRRTRGSG